MSRPYLREETGEGGGVIERFCLKPPLVNLFSLLGLFV